MHTATKLAGELAEVTQVRAVVRVFEEAVSAVVSSLDDVNREAGNYDSRRPGHRPENDARAATLTAK
jgi:hypothetical protein